MAILAMGMLIGVFVVLAAASRKLFGD